MQVTGKTSSGTENQLSVEIFDTETVKTEIVKSIKKDSIVVFSLPDVIIDTYGNSLWLEAISDIFDNRESYDFTNYELKILEYLVGI